MNTPRLILKNTAALTTARIGELVGNLVLIFYLSRLLQAEGLGIYATVLAVFQTVSIGCGAGFDSFIPRELSKDLSLTNRYLIHAGLIALTSALALLAAVQIVIPHLGYLPQTSVGIYIISLAFIPAALRAVLDATFIAHQKATLITATTLFSVLGRILASLLVLYLGFGVIDLIIVFTTFSYLTLLVMIYFLIRHITVPHWEIDWSFLWGMLRELKVFVGLALLGALFSQVELIILSLTQGETQVGFYSAALKLVTVWYMVPTSYITVVFPVLTVAYQESKQKAADIQNRSIKYLWSGAFPLTVGLMVTADVIIPQFYGPGFEESISTLRLLAWFLLLSCLNMVLWRVLIVRGEQHIVLRGQLIADVLRAFLALILTPGLGCQGAAWALIGGRLAYAVYHAYYVKRDGTPLPILQLGWRFALASAVMGIFAWAYADSLHLFILVPLAAVVYAALIIVLRAFSADDLALFRQILQRGRKLQPEVQNAAVID